MRKFFIVVALCATLFSVADAQSFYKLYQAYPSSKLADTIGMNTRACQGSPTFPLPTQTAPATPVLTGIPWALAIVGGTDSNGVTWPGLKGVVHIRDGGTGQYSGCVTSTFPQWQNFANYMHVTYGWDFLQNYGPCDLSLNISGLQDGTLYNKGVTAASEFSNEYENVVKSYAWLNSTAAAGSTTLAVPNNFAPNMFVPGQNYLLGEGANQETVTVASCPTVSSFVVTAPTVNAHKSVNTTLSVASAVNDTTITVASSTGFVAGDPVTLDCKSPTTSGEVAVVSSTAVGTITFTTPLTKTHGSGAEIAESCIYHTASYGPDINIALQRARSVSPPNAILTNASLAAPANSNNVGTASVPYVNIQTDHTYPQGRNPEGPDGTSKTGNAGAQTSVGCTASSSSYIGGGCSASRAGAYLPRWIGETGWPSQPPGKPNIAGQFDIPEDVVTRYIPRLWLNAVQLGIPRIYLYSEEDTSGCQQQFGNYGIVGIGLNQTCVSNTYPGTPFAKGGYNALSDLLALTFDQNCVYPQCQQATSGVTANIATPSSGPAVNQVLFQNTTTNKMIWALWLGGQEYDTNQTGTCTATLTCFGTAVATQNITITFADPAQIVNGNPQVYTFDTVTADCTQGNANYVNCGHFTAPTTPTFSGSTTGSTWTPTLSTTPIILTWNAPKRQRLPDPGPTSTPLNYWPFTNVSPPPQGGSLGLAAPGPLNATDAAHIDWQAFCVAHAANCTNGEPNYVTNDANMVGNVVPASTTGLGLLRMCTSNQFIFPYPNQSICGFEPGVYYATTSDPQFTVTTTNAGATGHDCTTAPIGTTGSLNGSTIYAPANAVAQLNSDGHMSIKQPNGTIVQLYQVGGTNAGGGRIPATAGALTVVGGGCAVSNTANEGTSSWFFGSGYATAIETSRFMVRPEDLAGNVGDGTDTVDPKSFYHAVYLSLTNNIGPNVFPAGANDGICDAAHGNAITTRGGAQPQEGMVMYIDSAGQAAIDAWTPASPRLLWLKRLLGTFHRHGGFDLDSSGCNNTGSGYFTNLLMWGPQSSGTVNDAFLTSQIEPLNSTYAGGGNNTNPEVYMDLANASYNLRLAYQVIPGFTIANIHFLNTGCAEIAIKGTSSNPC